MDQLPLFPSVLRAWDAAGEWASLDDPLGAAADWLSAAFPTTTDSAEAGDQPAALDDIPASSLVPIVAAAVVVLYLWRWWRSRGAHSRPSSPDGPAFVPVDCFYCSTRSYLEPEHLAAGPWCCPHCGATNAFDESGEFADLSAFSDPAQNPPPLYYSVPDPLRAARPTKPPAATRADAVLCRNCLQNQEIYIRTTLVREDEKDKSTFDWLCGDCERNLARYWASHYEWFVDHQRTAAGRNGAALPGLPHLSLAVVTSVPVPIRAWHLGLMLFAAIAPWIIGAWVAAVAAGVVAPPQFEWTSWSTWLVAGYAFVELARNPMYAARWHYRDHPSRAFYYRIFGRALARYRILCMIPRLFVLGLQVFALTLSDSESPLGASRAAWLWGAVAASALLALVHRTWSVEYNALISYAGAYLRGPPAGGHLTPAEMLARLNLTPADVSDPSHSPSRSASPHSPDHRGQQHPRRRLPVSPTSPRTATQNLMDRISSWSLGASPSAPAPAPAAPSRARTGGVNPVFAPPASALNPSLVKRPQGFGTLSSFRARMDADPRFGNLPTQIHAAPLALGVPGSDPRTATAAAAPLLRNLARAAWDDREAKRHAAAAAAHAARDEALKPSAPPVFVRPVRILDDDEEEEKFPTAFASPPRGAYPAGAAAAYSPPAAEPMDVDSRSPKPPSGPLGVASLTQSAASLASQWWNGVSAAAPRSGGGVAGLSSDDDDDDEDEVRGSPSKPSPWGGPPQQQQQPGFHRPASFGNSEASVARLRRPVAPPRWGTTRSVNDLPAPRGFGLLAPPPTDVDQALDALGLS
ncbi:hypothetical protein H9P43_000980 [Blastocladiella emersonii ATCC 22665]|nr:hypothetical protein H9P43_000980 [Blastocladiella emersonii ATCC 22665]